MFRTLLLLLPATLLCQPQLAWEKWAQTTSLRAHDVTADGRYVVVIEEASSTSNVLAVYDTETKELLKYRRGPTDMWQRIDMIDDRTVRVASLVDLAEFDLVTRTWTRHVTNTDVASRCSTSGRMQSETNVYTNTFLLTEMDCKPPRIRMYAWEDLRLLKTVDIPAPFTQAVQGRTRDELIFYTPEIGLGLNALSIMPVPENTFIDDIYAVNNEVYVLFKRNSLDSVMLCRVDLDKRTIVASRMFDDNIGYTKVHATPDPGQVHILTNRQSPVVDRLTLETIYISPVRTHDRMRKFGSTYVLSEIGRHLYTTNDPSKMGDTLLRNVAATRSATQDHLGRIVLVDDTVKIVDPATGTYRPTDIVRTSIFVPWAGHLIADPTHQTLTITTTGQVRTGEDLREVVCTIGPLPENDQGTSHSLLPYLRIDRSTRTVESWLQATGHYGIPEWTKLWACRWQGRGFCSQVDAIDTTSYDHRASLFPSPRVHPMYASYGRVAFMTQNTTITSQPMLGVGERYLWRNSRAQQHELRGSDGVFIDSVDLGINVVALAASDATQQILCWRSSDSSLCLYDLPTRTLVWSTRLWSKPTSVVMDRSGGWCFVVQQNYGLQQLYTFKTSSISEAGNQSIRLSPNPASEMITIFGDDVTSWELYDAVGRPVQQGTQSTFAAPEVSGMYYVRVQAGGRWTLHPLAVTR